MVIKTIQDIKQKWLNCQENINKEKNNGNHKFKIKMIEEAIVQVRSEQEHYHQQKANVRFKG